MVIGYSKGQLGKRYQCSQGSRLVFQSVVLQPIFATLNMFFREFNFLPAI